MKIFLGTCLLLFASHSSFAETLIVNFNHGLAQQAEEAVDMRQEQQAGPDEENVYDDDVYDYETASGEASTDLEETYSN